MKARGPARWPLRAAAGASVAAATVGCGGPCPSGMVLIQGGSFTQGFPLPRQPWMEPPREVALQAYCIDVHEYPNRVGALPRADVTWAEAAALCAAEGKRLCTSAEWERACRGPEGRRYSYGDARDPARCNTPIEGSGPGISPPPVRPIGAFPYCVTTEGVRDLDGSLSEWVSDPWDGPPEPFQPDAQVDGAWRTLRGGTMWSRTFYGQDCSSRHGHGPTFANMDDGLRCCAAARG